MISITTAIISITTTIISSGVTYFFTRKKYNSEVDNNLISNMQESLEFYTKLSDDNAERLKDILENNKVLKEQFEEVLAENNTLRMEIVSLRKQIGTLTKELKNFSAETKVKK